MAETLTKAEWTEIERRLASPYGGVRLVVDGYALMLRVEPIKVRRYAIVVYINEYMRGAWLLNDCEERRRFLRPQVRYLMPASRRKAFEREFGKRACAKHDINKTFTSYTFYWTSFAVLRRHLIANNEHIAVVPDGQA